MKKFLIIVLMLVFVSPVFANEWKLWRKFKDVTPVSVSGSESSNFIVTMKSGKWFSVGGSYIKKTIYGMNLNSVGTFYSLENSQGEWAGGNNSIKWVENKELTRQRKAFQFTTKNVKTKTPQPKKSEVAKPTVWIKSTVASPPKNTAVLVRYQNKLLTVAFLNIKNQWILNTSKDEMFSKPITTIVEWRLIK